MSHDLSPRVILYHKHPTSARTRFLKLATGSVCAFAPLPTLATMMESCPEADEARPHPAACVREAGQKLGLEDGVLEAIAEYRERVDIAGGPVDVFLARFTGIDPPFAAMEVHNASFIDLTQARNLPRVELELLRKAYELVLGG